MCDLSCGFIQIKHLTSYIGHLISNGFPHHRSWGAIKKYKKSDV